MELIGYIYKQQLPIITEFNYIPGHYNADNYSALEKLDIHFDDSNIVEKRNDLIPIVCASVVLTRNNEILTLKHETKPTSNSPDQQDITSLYIGHKLSLEDLQESNMYSFISSMRRAMGDNTGYNVEDKLIHSPIIAYVNDTKKLTKCAGIFFPIIVDQRFDITCENMSCEWQSIDEAKYMTLDQWSDIIIDAITYDHSLEI